MSCNGIWCPACATPADAEHCAGCVPTFLEGFAEGTWVRIVRTKHGVGTYTPTSRWREFLLWLRFAKDRYRWTR